MFSKIVQIWCKNKYLFAIAFLFSFAVHFYILCNYIPNHDDLAGIVSNIDLSVSGRWFGKYATRVSSLYTMHSVNGIISIVLISLAAVWLTEILRIRDNKYRILILILCITFPTIAGILSYMQTADGYALAILLAVSGCYFLQHQSIRNFIVAICCFTFSCGIYQAYITLSIGIVYITILREFLRQGKFGYDSWKIILYKLSAVVISLFAYLGVLKIVLKISGQVLSSYSNIDTMGKFTLEEILKNLMDVYRNFGKFFLGYEGIYSVLVVVVNVLMGILTIALLIDFWGKCYGINKLYFLVLILLIPMAFNSIELFKPAENNCSILTTYSLVLVYVLEICLLYDVHGNEGKCKKFGDICIIIGMVLIIWNNYLLTNEIYMKLDLTWEKSKLWANRLLSDIQDIDGYQINLPIMIDGLSGLNSDKQDDAILNELDYLLLTDSYTFCVDSDAYNENLLFHYYRNLLDINVISVDDVKKGLIRESEIYKSMPFYPNDGGVQMIDNVIVVKIGRN